jgi:hypothetical protein
LISFMISPNTDSHAITETYRIIVYGLSGSRECDSNDESKDVIVYNHDKNTFPDVLNNLKNIVLARM